MKGTTRKDRALYTEDPLQKPIQYLKGVGDKLSLVLGKADLKKVEDLLYFLPRTYEDRRKVSHIADLNQTGDTLVVVGQIVKAHPVFYQKSGRRTFQVTLADVRGKLGSLSLVWFRVPFIAKKLQEGAFVVVTGKLDQFRGQLQMTHPDLEMLGKNVEPSDLSGQGILPIYTEAGGLYQKTLRKILKNAVETYALHLQDPLPEEIRSKHQLPKLSDAIWNLHRPSPNTEMQELLEAKTPSHRRLIYEEFFELSVGLSLRKRLYKQAEGIVFPKPEVGWEQLKNNLSFKFTNAQKRVLQEIFADMNSNKVMHRLVQGDVGSGKTVIAAAAALVALEAGAQVALMAPTEILVEQHSRIFKKWFEGLPYRCDVLTGSLPVAKRREILADLESGKIQMLFGTHALFEDTVKFKNLGFVVVDEQHRFGVRQRAALTQKGKNPDLLVMTATPIPRSLALTLYGDLDLSVIDEMPPGRQPIETKVYVSSGREALWARVKKELEAGRQAYFVYPLIEESEKLDLMSVTEALPELENAFEGFQVRHLHGKLKSEEKQEILDAFRANKIQVLVSTTVVEVGVDVPNATVMVIEHAERFGLSQLHQLRGRVGRGAQQSYCYLVASHLGTEEIVKRLRSLESVHDGFKLSEIDLEMRGPGEILGTKQSGDPIFWLARLPRDFRLLETARQDAEAWVDKDPDLLEAPILKARLAKRAEKALLQ